MIIWLISSVIYMLTSTAVPLITPWLNKYAFGSGIVGWYFIGSAIISFIIGTLTNTLDLYPDTWILLSGLLFGAGITSVQKTTERSRDPALGIAFPSSRAFLTALLSFLIIGLTSSNTVIMFYVLQFILCILLVVVIYWKHNLENDFEWLIYAVISTFCLSFSDVILKKTGSIKTIFNDTFWFTLSGAFIPILINLKKTNSIFPTFRKLQNINKTTWYSIFLIMIAVFFIKIKSRTISISLVSNPAYTQMITSLSLPLLAFLVNKTNEINISAEEYTVYLTMTGVTILSSIFSI